MLVVLVVVVGLLRLVLGVVRDAVVLLLRVVRVVGLAATATAATTTATARGPVPVLVRLVALVLGVRLGLLLVLGGDGGLLGRKGDRGGGRLGLDGLAPTAAATARTALGAGLGLGGGDLGGLLGLARRALGGQLLLGLVALVVRRGGARGRRRCRRPPCRGCRVSRRACWR
ncbi:hypothetical protein ACN6K8_002815 [[Kitasatospora] papulosa]|uniref:hypothetical protein n=1 Tax=[Kitasatospora] papulosa TaxID=1464011 RepID=UPI00403CE1C8